ncbi:MAG: nuclear transport factor 2 family protein [Oceanospirillaceae bacterium]
MLFKRHLMAVAIGVSLVLSNVSFASIKTIDAQTQKSIKIAEGFYEDVLLYRNLNNFSRYIGDTYLQHAPAYGDGPAKLLSAVAGELTNDPGVKIEILRTIAEGDYVAIHSAWTTSSGETYVYVDVWRVAGGKLVEHWDHYQQAPEKSANLNTMFEGPNADIYSKQDTEQNTQRALAILATFNNPSDTSAIKKYVADEYIQHNPYVADGAGPLVGYLSELAKNKVHLKTDIAKTIAMGDMVLIHSRQTNLDVKGDLGTGYMDIFRFNDAGKIVEHWDIEEKVTGESSNKNDIFGYSKS